MKKSAGPAALLLCIAAGTVMGMDRDAGAGQPRPLVAPSLRSNLTNAGVGWIMSKPSLLYSMAAPAHHLATNIASIINLGSQGQSTMQFPQMPPISLAPGETLWSGQGPLPGSENAWNQVGGYGFGMAVFDPSLGFSRELSLPLPLTGMGLPPQPRSAARAI